MTTSIYKFKLPVKPGLFELDLQYDYQVVKVMLQNGEPHMWIQSDFDSVDTNPQSFELVFTGDTVDDLASHIGSYIYNDQVFHLYELW